MKLHTPETFHIRLFILKVSSNYPQGNFITKCKRYLTYEGRGVLSIRLYNWRVHYHNPPSTKHSTNPMLPPWKYFPSHGILFSVLSLVKDRDGRRYAPLSFYRQTFGPSPRSDLWNLEPEEMEVFVLFSDKQQIRLNRYHRTMSSSLILF